MIEASKKMLVQLIGELYVELDYTKFMLCKAEDQHRLASADVLELGKRVAALEQERDKWATGQSQH